MRCETMHSAAAKGNIPELQVDENAAASTSPDVAPWWMQVSAGGHSDGEGGHRNLRFERHGVLCLLFFRVK